MSLNSGIFASFGGELPLGRRAVQRVARVWCVQTLTWVMVVAGFLGVGCGDVPKQAYERAKLPTLSDDTAIPPPTGAVVLTVTGKIGKLNTKTGVEFDLPTLEQAGMVHMRVMDPNEKRMVRYSGPLMLELLEILQVSSDATTLHVTSANDKVVDIPIADLKNFPVVLALKADDAYLAPDYRGPSMLVWPYETHTFDHAKTDPLWAWQIKAFDVR